MKSNDTYHLRLKAKDSQEILRGVYPVLCYGAQDDKES